MSKGPVQNVDSGCHLLRQVFPSAGHYFALSPARAPHLSHTNRFNAWLARPGLIHAVGQLMIIFALGMLALAAGGVAYTFYAAARAPLGYEDEQGFHFVEPAPEMEPEGQLAMVPESSR